MYNQTGQRSGKPSESAQIVVDWKRDSMIIRFAATGLLLLIIYLGFALTIGRGRVFVVLPWVEPTAEAFAILVALSIAFYSFSVYRLLGTVWALWLAAGFWVNAIFAAFYVLSFPGLIGMTGLIGLDPNALSWPFHLKWTGLALFLTYAPIASWPHLDNKRRVDLALIVLSTIISVLICVLVVEWGSYLPVLLSNGEFTPINLVWIGVLTAMFTLGCILSLYAYLQQKGAMLGYIATFQLVSAIRLGSDLFGGQLFDVVWYFNRVVFVSH